MGCPEGTRAFTRAFRAKRELQCIFLGKGRSLLHPNTAKRSLLQSLSTKTERKIGPKSARKY